MFVNNLLNYRRVSAYILYNVVVGKRRPSPPPHHQQPGQSPINSVDVTLMSEKHNRKKTMQQSKFIGHTYEPDSFSFERQVVIRTCT